MTGSGVGKYHTSLACLDLKETNDSTGGTVFPIILQKLFDRVGFGWAVRISGFICLALCAIAVGTVTARVPPSGARKSAAWFDFKLLNDTCYLLVIIGSCFISLGKQYSSVPSIEDPVNYLRH